MADQKSKWQATRKAKMDELFTGHKYKIVNEFSSEEPKKTPLGYTVKNGFVIESTDGTQRFYVGKSIINILADNYNAITKPEPKKRGRPKRGTLEQASEWANREMPADAQQVTQAGPTYSNPNENQQL